MAKLFWLQPDSSIIEFPLKAEQNLIGRTSRCDVRIKHPGISAEHAVVRVLPGSATVQDLGSTNGTRVNGKRIELHTLRHGDQIGVGRERLMYFAELDEAAKFVQPESIEPFALPAPGGEIVNTAPVAQPVASANLQSAPVSALSVPPHTGTEPTITSPSVGGQSGMEPMFDAGLLAALPKGASLVKPAGSMGGAVPMPATRAPLSGRDSVPDVVAAAPATEIPSSAAAGGVTQPLSASVAVLTGTAAGKRYPLNQPSVTLGKEGKQVVEFIRTAPTRWQIRQREGVTPAYINGDALEGSRDLSAGDVIELTGVRLRFEILLNR